MVPAEGEGNIPQSDKTNRRAAHSLPAVQVNAHKLDVL